MFSMRRDSRWPRPTDNIDPNSKISKEKIVVGFTFTLLFSSHPCGPSMMDYLETSKNFRGRFPDDPSLTDHTVHSIMGRNITGVKK